MRLDRFDDPDLGPPLCTFEACDHAGESAAKGRVPIAVTDARAMVALMEAEHNRFGGRFWHHCYRDRIDGAIADSAFVLDHRHKGKAQLLWALLWAATDDERRGFVDLLSTREFLGTSESPASRLAWHLSDFGWLVLRDDRPTGWLHVDWPSGRFLSARVERPAVFVSLFDAGCSFCGAKKHHAFLRCLSCGHRPLPGNGLDAKVMDTSGAVIDLGEDHEDRLYRLPVNAFPSLAVLPGNPVVADLERRLTARRLDPADMEALRRQKSTLLADPAVAAIWGRNPTAEPRANEYYRGAEARDSDPKDPIELFQDYIRRLA